MASVAKRDWTHNGEARSAWVVRYKEGGKHRSKQFEKKKDADTYKRKVERETEDGVHIADADALTVREICEAFMRYQEERFRDGRIGSGSLACMKTAVDNDFIPYFGHRKIKEVRSSEIMDFYSHLRSRPQVIPSGLSVIRTVVVAPKAGLAPRTARARISILKQLFDYARLHGHLKLDVMATAVQQLRGIKKTRIRNFDLDSIRALLAAAEDRSVRGRRRSHMLMRCFVGLGAFCGLRIGEIKGLTLDHLDLDRRAIEVRHSLTAKDELKGPKTSAGNRTVPVPSVAIDVLRQWIDMYYVPNERRLIFRQEDGGPVRSGSFHSSYWRPLLKRAGLLSPTGDQLHFHALRHFHSSWLIHNGISIMDVASRMGHESFDMTLGTYAHSILGGDARHGEIDAMTSRLAQPPLSIAHDVRTGT